MNIPDELLDYLADEYDRQCIDPRRYPFVKWVAMQVEKMGWKVD